MRAGCVLSKSIRNGFPKRTQMFCNKSCFNYTDKVCVFDLAYNFSDDLSFHIYDHFFILNFIENRNCYVGRKGVTDDNLI